MSDEELANLSITLCHQTIYMLSKLLNTQQERFVENGGIKERMYAARTGYRKMYDEELAALKKENASLRQRITQLEEYIANLEREESEESEYSE